MTTGINVLLVDDRPENLLALSAILEGPDLNLVEALSGEEALGLLLGHDFALVLLDVQMPGMDGFETARLMRGSERTRHIPIIFVTAISKEQKYVFEGYESGAVDYLFKPLEPDIVRSKVRVFVDLYRQRYMLLERTRELQQANEALDNAYQKIKEDLEAAGKVQHQLLPAVLPDHPGVRFAWKCVPCDELAGDILNILQFDDEWIGLYLLDVSGHGVQAALLSSALSCLLTAMPLAGSILCEREPGTGHISVIPPLEVARRLNDRFPLNIETDQYFTIQYGIFNLRERAYRYVSAGHPGPVLLRADGQAEVLTTPALPIGWLQDDPRLREHTLSLAPGDRVVLYSDGVVETRDGGDVQSGESHLVQTLKETQSLDLDASLETVVEQVKGVTDGRHRDDISLLGFEVG